MSPKPKRIECAPQSRLQAVEHLAPRFFREVLGWDYEECFVTDESDLYDFADLTGDRSVEVEGMFDRLESHYLMDGRRVNSTRIVDLLEFLAAQGVTA
jgi:hypothetical protein